MIVPEQTMPISLRKKRVTGQDVAERAGVSRSMVSRAFTPGAYVDPEKRARVRSAAEELAYRPNALAAGLQSARSNLVAIFVGEMANEYDKEVTTQLVTGLNGVGKWPIVIGGSGEAARDAMNNVLRYPLDALILRSGSLDSDIVEACARLGIPVISCGRILNSPGVDNICCRNFDGMAQGTMLLLERGRLRFGFIGGPARFTSSQDRREGIVQTLRDHGLTLIAEAEGLFTVDSGYRAAQTMTKITALDALICANDAMAIGALSALRDSGHRVPDDISVIGFDDISMAAWPAFALTTLRNPIDALVDAVLTLLDSRGRQPDRGECTILLTADLVLRDTH
jgi:DNA-binding LacI/PurR family transcriptional regulator